MTDDQDIDYLISWDNRSFGRLYDTYYKALVNYAFRITNDLEKAEDAVQEMFSRMWEHHPAFSNVTALKAYLYTATRNQSINIIRQKGQKGQNFISLAAEEKFVTNSDNDECFFTEEIFRQLFDAINDMPQKQHDIFMLLVQGKKIKEISNILNISESTVKTQKQRGITKLKENIRNFELIICLFA